MVSIVTIVPTTFAAADSAGMIAGVTGDRPVPASATTQRIEAAAFVDSPRTGAILLVAPDGRNGTLITRNLSLRDDRQSLIVEYPRSIGPVAAGRSHKIELVSPTFDSAKTAAMEKNLSAMMAFGGVGDDRPPVIYTASAQGDEVVAPAVEDAFGGAELAPPPFVVLVDEVREPPRDVPAPRDPVPGERPVDQGDDSVVVPRDTGGDATPETIPGDRDPGVPRGSVPDRGDGPPERPAGDPQSPVDEPVSDSGRGGDDQLGTHDRSGSDDEDTGRDSAGSDSDDGGA